MAVTLVAALCAATAGCSWLGGSTPPPAAPIADEKPMVAPTATPPSKDFNLQVAKPLINPTTPDLSVLPVPQTPPPPVVMDQLTAPDPATLAALPEIAPPAPAPQRGKPIPPPPGPPADTVSALEAQPGSAANAPAPGADAPPRQQTASLPPPARAVTTTAAADATYRLVFAPQSADLPETAPPALQHLAAVMAQDPVLRLKFSSYASGNADNPVAARRLSLQRALSLRQALTALGVSSLRVDVLALGMTAAEPPADRIDIAPANPAN